MKTVSAAEMRELDRRTIEEFGTPGEILMERAGTGVANAVAELAAGPVLLVAGRGNNGGDVFAAAALLAETELDIEVWIIGSQSDIRDDALLHLKKMIRAGIVPKEIRKESDLVPGYFPDLIVDGLLGTGSKGAPRGLCGPVVDWINRAAETAYVLSIDIPSGIDSDSGGAEGAAVEADLTVTMALPKTGLIRPEATPFVGNIEVVDIGIPEEFINETKGCREAELIDSSDLLFPRRKRESHKGTYGHVLLIGGSEGFSGAIAMAARAAVRSGAGLVSVWTPQEVWPLVAQAAGPEVMVHPLERRDEITTAFDAVLIGPGLGRTENEKQRVEDLLKTCDVPLVLDAGALCVSPEQIAAANCPVVLTPHPGEFKRLFGEPGGDRWQQARHAAEQTGKTVVLKGAGTIVAESGKPLAINRTGNPGMAVGGSGDVLAGIITALIGQGIAPFDAAKAAVYLHGLAGDIAAQDLTQTSLLPTDIIDALPEAFRTIQAR